MEWIENENTKRKRINEISEIYDGKNLLTKQFIHLDLSNIDLSIIPMEQWEDCIFYNTSFKNTGIKFIPNKLKYIDWEEAKKLQIKHLYNGKYIYLNFCDFSDNDLSYLEHKDFCYINYPNSEIEKYGCNFRNTKINYFKDLYNIELDSSYEKYNYEDWDCFIHHVRPLVLDFKTLIKNPFLKIPSTNFILIIACSVGAIRKYYEDVKKETREKTVSILENYLLLDKEGHVRKLYNKFKSSLTLNGKYKFFLGSILRKN